MILAGDVGGTKVHLALYDFVDGRLKSIRDQKYPRMTLAVSTMSCISFWALEETLHRRQKKRSSQRASVVPGPVRDGRLKLTNLPWTLDTRDLVKSLSIPHIFSSTTLRPTATAYRSLRSTRSSPCMPEIRTPSATLG